MNLVFLFFIITISVPILKNKIPDVSFVEGESVFDFVIPFDTFFSTDNSSIVLSVEDHSNWTLANIAGPIELESEIKFWEIRDVFISEDIAYMVDNTYGLRILNVSVPSKPKYIGGYSYTTKTIISSFTYNGITYLCVSEDGLLILNTTEKSNVQALGTVDTTKAYQFVIYEGIGYIADHTSGLRIVNISDPFNPAILSTVDTYAATSLVVRDGIAYVADGSYGVQVIDVNDPVNPFLICTVDHTSGNAYEIVLRGNFLYVSYLSASLVIFNITNKTHPSFESVNDFQESSYISMSEDIPNYVFMDKKLKELAVVDVSNPSNPTVSKFWYFGMIEIRSIVAYKSSVFLSMRWGGMIIVDVSNPIDPVVVSGCSDEMCHFIGKSYDIISVGDYLYTADYYGAIKVIDVRDKRNPKVVGEYSPLNEQYAVESLIQVNENTLYATDRTRDLIVFDISNRTKPLMIQQKFISGQPRRVYRNPLSSGEYTFVQTFNVDGVHIINSSDSLNPTTMSKFKISTSQVDAKVLHAEKDDDFAYQYQKFPHNNITIIDIRNKTHPSFYSSLHYPLYGSARDIYVNPYHNTLYLSAGDEMSIVDVSDHRYPKKLEHSLDLTGYFGKSNIIIDYSQMKLLSGGSTGLSLIEISNKTAPIILEKFNSGKHINSIAYNGKNNYVYASYGRDGNGVAFDYWGIQIFRGSIRVYHNEDVEIFCGQHEVKVIAEDATGTAETTFKIFMGNCSGKGYCGSESTKVDCICFDGYSGDRCEFPICYGIPSNFTKTSCSGFGDCVGVDHCVCDEGYFGLTCNVSTCDGIFSNHSSVCSNGRGICNISSHTCECHGDYYGDFCQNFDCYGVSKLDNGSVCSNHGFCSDFDVCKCSSNYYGIDCNITTCNGIFNNDSDVCGSHGNCEVYERCICSDHYFGEDCNITKCFGVMQNSSLTCNSHGKCKDYDVCNCVSGYFGEYCNTTICHGIWGNTTKVCNGHGDCITEDKCDCYERYFGEYCNTTLCYDILSNSSDTCSSHGVCSDYNDCDCEENYYGAICNVTECWDIWNNVSTVCNGHGACRTFNECECDSSSFYGDKCENWKCFGIENDNVETVCGSHGYCQDLNKCFCQSGYQPLLQAGGECVVWTCGFYSKDSELVCNGRGTCIGSNKCKCSDGYLGDDCETFSCGFYDKDDTENVCSGKGKCVSPGICDCGGSRAGDFCQDNLLYYTVMTPVLSTTGIAIGLVVLIVVLMICCLFCICLIALCIGSGFLIWLAWVVLFQKLRMRKFGKLKNIDLLLQEQSLEDDDSIAHIRINQDLFKISFDELKITKKLGEGGSQSIVYQASWKGREVAFKCFRTKSFLSEQNHFDDFEREVEVLASVSHPNILQFFGCVLDPPRVGIVMEFCANGDLVCFLGEYREENDNEMYPFEEKYRIIQEIISSMDYLHCRSIIHRDIKLENVLLNIEETAKLMDFGLSRHIKDMDSKKTTRIGTSIYMPAEVTLGNDYSEKCDVYSFSILVYIWLTEIMEPYRGGTNVEIRVANDPSYRPKIEKLKEILPEGFEWVSEIVTNCWDHNPENRYSFSDLDRIFRENKQQSSTDSSPSEFMLSRRSIRASIRKSKSKNNNNNNNKVVSSIVVDDGKDMKLLREENEKLKSEIKELKDWKGKYEHLINHFDSDGKNSSSEESSSGSGEK